MPYSWPLMQNNITREDLDALIRFLEGMPILTQSANVRAFEAEWSRWLGVKHSVFVNSGASANLATVSALRFLSSQPDGEIIVPPLTWVSDIAAVLQNGFTPVFVDIDPRTLCLDNDQVIARLTDRTRAVFVTHCQGFNGLSDRLLRTLEQRHIPLIEDVCEAHGATHHGRKLGSFGLASNFSFYFAHHMTTIEGGMISTNDDDLHQVLRMLRSHGMVREATDEKVRERYVRENPELNPEFIFAFPAYNMRNTEIGAVLGRRQLERLDANNAKRRHNFELFLAQLDPDKYRTDFELAGSCNYALNLILRRADPAHLSRVIRALTTNGIEFRRGSAGGGNQMRQPYLRGIVPAGAWSAFPEVEHVHFYGFYIGNYPDLPAEKIRELTRLLNTL